METVHETQREMKEWVNRLTFTQRPIIVQMYCNGISISAITKIYQVHHSSIRYHLRKAGVYIKNKRGDVNMKEIKVKNQSSSLNFFNTKGQRFKVQPDPIDFTDSEHEKKFPKNYREYVQREADRNSILLKNGISNLRIKITNTDDDPEFFKTER